MKFLLALALVVATTISATDYARKDWVSSSLWSKARKKTLARDMVNGAWVCKYSGVAIPESRLVDIDHIIPIKYAFDITNGSFTSAKKHAFAVDDSNLVSVSQHENRSKGDAGLSGYMPQQNGCFYLSHWRYMVKKYKLHLPAQDSAILAKGLKICKL